MRYSSQDRIIPRAFGASAIAGAGQFGASPRPAASSRSSALADEDRAERLAARAREIMAAARAAGDNQMTTARAVRQAAGEGI